MKGIDVPIEKLRSYFENNLWTDKNFTAYGRIFRDETYNRRPIPKRYVGNGEYEDVLLSDFKDGICFFDVMPKSGINIAYSTQVWICFAINLEALYPLVGERATEYAHAEVKNILLGSIFTPTELIRGLAAFRDYDLVESSDNLQPYYLFRFTTELVYQDNC